MISSRDISKLFTFFERFGEKSISWKELSNKYKALKNNTKEDLQKYFNKLAEKTKYRFLNDLIKTMTIRVQKKSKEFTQKEREEMSKIWYRHTLDKAKEKGVTKVLSGNFYTYNYTAKTYPDPLTYYDRKPLVLMLDTKGKYYLGLNFHHLSRAARIKLLQKIAQNNSQSFFNNKRLKFNYADISNSKSQWKFAYVVIRKYIKRNVKKKIIQIDNTDMLNVINLRSENFTGISGETAYKISSLKALYYAKYSGYAKSNAEKERRKKERQQFTKLY